MNTSAAAAWVQAALMVIGFYIAITVPYKQHLREIASKREDACLSRAAAYSELYAIYLQLGAAIYAVRCQIERNGLMDFSVADSILSPQIEFLLAVAPQVRRDNVVDTELFSLMIEVSVDIRNLQTEVSETRDFLLNYPTYRKDDHMAAWEVDLYSALKRSHESILKKKIKIIDVLRESGVVQVSGLSLNDMEDKVNKELTSGENSSG